LLRAWIVVHPAAATMRGGVMRCGRICAFLLTMLVAPQVAGAEPVTAANWRRHPAIVEIRAIYRETRQAETAGRLRKEQRTFEYCRAYADGDRTLYLSRTGAVRSYHVVRGSHDSAVQAAYYAVERIFLPVIPDGAMGAEGEQRSDPGPRRFDVRLA
jgi:hypothetical protein